jgi:hypothetical protein
MNNSNKLKNSSFNKESLNRGDLVLSSPIKNYLFSFHTPPELSSSFDDISPSGHIRIPINICGIILQTKHIKNTIHCLVLWSNEFGFGWTDNHHLKIISNIP